MKILFVLERMYIVHNIIFTIDSQHHMIYLQNVRSCGIIDTVYSIYYSSFFIDSLKNIICISYKFLFNP